MKSCLKPGIRKWYRDKSAPASARPAVIEPVSPTAASHVGPLRRNVVTIVHPRPLPTGEIVTTTKVLTTHHCPDGAFGQAAGGKITAPSHPPTTVTSAAHHRRPHETGRRPHPGSHKARRRRAEAWGRRSHARPHHRVPHAQRRSSATEAHHHARRAAHSERRRQHPWRGRAAGSEGEARVAAHARKVSRASPPTVARMLNFAAC